MSHDQAIIEVKQGSERNFGLVFAAVFFIVAVFPLLFGGQLRVWSLLVAAAFLLVALFKPGLLAKPNRYWFKFGMLLGAVIAPIVMAIVYVVTIIPMGLFFRLKGADALMLKFDPSAKSYWLNRDTSPQPMKNQF